MCGGTWLFRLLDKSEEEPKSLANLFKKLLPQLSCCFISISSPCAVGISALDLQGC